MKDNNRFIEEGDVVRVRSLEWFNTFKDGDNNIGQFVSEMSDFCGRDVKILGIRDDYDYELDIDEGLWKWQEYMFEPSSIFSNFIKKFCKNCDNNTVCCDLCLFNSCAYYKFNRGDKVKIRSREWFVVNDFKGCEQYSLIDNIATISNILKLGKNYYYYMLDISDNMFWPDFMFDFQSYNVELLSKYCDKYCIHSQFSNKCKNCFLNNYK